MSEDAMETDGGPSLLALPALADALEHVLGFLEPGDLRAAEEACRPFREAAKRSPFAWKTAATRRAQNVAVIGDQPYLVWKGLCADTEALERRQQGTQQLYAAIGASSCDRVEESAANALTPSVCDVAERSEKCSCHPLNGNRPCYWSSGSSPADSLAEYIDFALSGFAVLVTEVRLRPYCATWQPDQPTFAPRHASVSFGAYSPSLAGGAGPGAAAAAAGGGPSGGSEPEPMDEPMEVEPGSGCGARSYDGAHERTAVPHSREERVVARYEPPLLVLGGHMRLRLEGAWQRQTFAEFDDDFYLCVSHVQALGAKCVRLRAARAAEGPHDEMRSRPRPGWPEPGRPAGDWRVAAVGPEPMLKCSVCGRSAGKLLRCSVCKAACYCCKAHQLVHWPAHRLACKKHA